MDVPQALALVPSPPDAGRLARLGAARERARSYVDAARARNTLRAYRAAWADFAAWCDEQRAAALPASPEAVALYLSELADRRRPATLQLRLSAISQAHQAAGLPSPTKDVAVRTVWAGIRRTLGTAQTGKAPALTEDVRAMAGAAGGDLAGLRDRALLLVGFAGAFRRSELVALEVDDAAFTSGGLVLTIRRSKTDQEGARRKLGIPLGRNAQTCPVRALKAWLAAARIRSGPLFRGVDRHGNVAPARLSDKAVALVVKRRAEHAGLDPALYAGHSLRAGFATSAAAARVEERVIAQQTGHKSMQVLRRYIREGNLFAPGQNAAAAVGL